MRIHLIIIALIFLSIQQSNSQEKIVCGEIWYDNIKTYPLGSFKMVFNNKGSYNWEINIKKRGNKEEEEIIGQKLTKKIIIGRKNLTPAFYYNNRIDFYFREVNLDNKTYLIKEEKTLWNWKLYEDTKKIGSFTCNKATVSFRGRNYSAWFTNEIPLPYGPLTFYGLPGVILELTSDENSFIGLHIVAKKIKITYEQEDSCTLPILDNKTLEKAIPIREYVKIDKKIENAYLVRLNSKLPKGTKPFVPAEECEDCPKTIGRFGIFDEKK